MSNLYKPYYLLEPEYNLNLEHLWGDQHSSFFYPFDLCFASLINEYTRKLIDYLIGNYNSLFIFKDDVIINLVTSFLIILGGIGFLVIKDVLEKKNFKKLTLHSKIVIKTTLILIFGGTIILKLTQNITWLGAFFASVSARTAGFVTYPFDVFNRFGLLFITILMFIGACAGSTGGGRLAAAKTLSNYGISIKISNDGSMQGFKMDKNKLRVRTLFVL